MAKANPGAKEALEDKKRGGAGARDRANEDLTLMLMDDKKWRESFLTVTGSRSIGNKKKSTGKWMSRIQLEKRYGERKAEKQINRGKWDKVRYDVIHGSLYVHAWKSMHS